MPKLLIVEDDIALAEIYKEHFGADGFSVDVAESGEEAIEKVRLSRPDLIILDIMLPKLSGFDVLSILKSKDETRGIKVLALSALSQKQDVERGKELGADDYLIKSESTLSDIAAKVKELTAPK